MGDAMGLNCRKFISSDIVAVYQFVARLSSDELPIEFSSSVSRHEFEVRFSESLKFDIHDFFVILDSDNNIAGCIYSYDYRVYDENCKVTLLYSEDKEASELDNIVKKFTEYMFREYPLVKIFSEIYQEKFMSFFMNNGYKVECVLRKYKNINGDYRDCYILGRERQGE